MKFTHTTKKVSQYLFFTTFLGLAACSGIHQNQTITNVVTPVAGSPENLQQEDNEPEVDPNLPKVELDQKTLEQLLIQNFASYNSQWVLSSKNSLAAAKSSGDYRLAQTSTLLALRGDDYELALEGAELWFELMPESETAKNLMFISQLGAGRTSQAIQTIGAFYVNDDINVTIEQVADLVVQQKNQTSGIAVMSNFITENPQSAQAHLSAAYVAEVYRRYDDAQKWLDKAIELRPGWEIAAQMKSDILQSRGNTEERSQFLEEYAASHPESVNMNINYAADLARQERYQDAYVVMQQVIELDPKNSGALNYIAALAGQLEDTEQAEKYFRQSLNADPKNDTARWSLGRLAYTNEKYISAEKYFNGITEQDRLIEAQIQVANSRYHTQGLKKALSTLELLEPQTEGEYVGIALARHNLLVRDFKFEEALGHINEVLLNLPNDLDLLYSRAIVAAELKKVDIAEADFRAILKLEPDNADTLNALGYTLADQTERYEEARDLIAKALEIKPDAAYILDSMGWVLYRLNDYPKALEHLQKAYDLTDEVEIASHLGEVLWVSGEQQKALEVWQKALNAEPSSPVLKDTLQRFDVSLSPIKAN